MDNPFVIAAIILGALGLIAVMFFLVARLILVKVAARVTQQMNQTIEEAARRAGQASVDYAGKVLAAKGCDVQAIQTKFGQQAGIAAAGASRKIREYADKNGIDIDEAKAKFFEKTVKTAKLMDSAVVLPVIGGVGLDAVLGWFFPVIGDVAAKGVSIAIIFNGIQYGLPQELVGKMITNSLTDLLIGWIPLLGDVLDVFYRANNKNADLLREYLEQTGQLKKAA